MGDLKVNYPSPKGNGLVKEPIVDKTKFFLNCVMQEYIVTSGCISLVHCSKAYVYTVLYG